MIAIAYVSSSVHFPTRMELEYLLLDARTFNARVGVTGALLLHETTFLQYFEGPAAAAEEVYERIKRSRLHGGLVELMHEPVAGRQFGGWVMGFARAPRGTLLELAHSRWTAVAAKFGTGHIAEGPSLLMQFWRRARREE